MSSPSRQTTVDAVLQRVRTGWVASVFQDPTLAAAADDRERALERLRHLVESKPDSLPLRLHSRGESPRVERVDVDIAGLTGSRFASVQCSLDAVVRPGEDAFEVELPTLSVQFEIDELDQLAAACSEYLRLQLPPSFRFPALAGLLGTSDSHTEVRRLALDATDSTDPDLRARDGDPSTLESVARPLHRLQDQKDAPGAFERDVEVDRLLQSLTDERNRSALLVGPSGAGKTAVVQEAVSRILSEDVPEPLAQTPVWRISGGRLTAGAHFFGDWQERVLEIVDELEASGGLLFVDNLAELVTATSGDDGSEGVAGLLYPHVESGSLSLITELRPEQLDLVEQRNPTFVHALQRIWIDPMDGARTDAVLERVSFRLGRQHGVRLAPETRQKIVALVERFRASDALPGPAVELAERVARTHRDDAIEPESRSRPELQPRHAVEALASETGLPEELLDPNTDFSAADVRTFFEERIFSQPEAIDAMTDLVTILRAGLNPPDRPMGSYLFIGPTGVGKTQTALTLAEYLFGDEDRLLRFDMSEFQDRWSAARLVGRAKGDAGQLVRRVREEPFSVILLDEIEKAHETVFDMLLQVLGEGRLSDGLGQTVSLTNTVVVMTSNLGAEGPSNLGFEGSDTASDERLERHYVGEVESYFRPEFVGRLDRIVAFSPLGDDTARQLVERALEETLSREGLSRRDIEVVVDDAVVSHLVDQGFDERYGARPLRQTVEHEITARLADFLARNADLADCTLRIELQEGAPAVFHDS